MSEELTPGQAAFATYYGRQAGAALSMPDSWNMQSEGTRADWDAAAEAGSAGIRAERDRYHDVLQRLADEDTWVLGEGFGGGHAEDRHVRASLAKQALGEKVECCTECMVSLGLDLDDDDHSADEQNAEHYADWAAQQ